MFVRGSALPANAVSVKALRSIRLVLIALVGSAFLLGGVAAPAHAAPKPIPAVTAHPVLKLGDRGPAVSWLQQALGLKPNGYFNYTTRGRVYSLERKHNLPVNGVVAMKEWHRLGVQKDPAAARASRSTTRAGAPGTAAFGQKVLAIAATYKGAPYRLGGNGPAYDCSGFVSSVFRKVGYSLPRTSAGMRAVTPRISSPVAGDLVFVHNGRGGRVGHVGIYAGNGRWWEATRPGRALNLNKAWSSKVSYGRVR